MVWGTGKGSIRGRRQMGKRKKTGRNEEETCMSRIQGKRQ